MSKHTINPVKLTYSYPVKKRKYKGTERELRQRQFDEFNNQSRKKSLVIGGEVLEKTIHSYRMWFSFLKLGLELESQGAELVMKNSTRLEDGTKTNQITHKIRINKKKYEGWDLDQVLTLKFNDWWKTHRYLFVDEVTKVLKPNDEISSNPDNLTIQIDTRRRFTDIINDLRNMNKEQGLFKRVSRNKFSINGRVRYLTLLNRYNCLVLKLEDELSNKEILTHENQYIRPTDERTKDGYSTQKENENTLNTYGEVNYGRTIFDLISGSKKSFGAKQILLSVCDGYFMKHPTKDYLGL
jgi:hypothetical protein